MSLASADRRPVDPPPVVELKILEGEFRNDVTFSHNANFFLYTTLESARNIAPGRGNSMPQPFPVLTGMPVAGMAYLDRPSPAGYFIFPDLSVRHEGKYRLSFNLFEELKEAKDYDAEPAQGAQDNAMMRGNPMGGQSSHVHFRLEVKSEPFVVYSAKKFPGLAESTSLSRVVAEQGCRVRIRRDVRMRRRENKNSKEYDDYEDESAYPRSDRFATPDTYNQQNAPERARTISNAAGEPNPPYASIERRTSSHDLYYQHQQPYSQPAPASVAPPPSYPPHYAASAPGPYQPAPQANTGVKAIPTYGPPSQGYQYQQQPPQPHGRQMSSGSSYGYQTPQTYQPPQFPAQPSYPQPAAEYKAPRDYSRPAPPAPTSVPQEKVYTPVRESNPFPAIDTKYTTGPSYYNADPRSATPTNVAQVLPPLKINQPLVPKHDMPAPIVASSPAVAVEPARSGKRSYDKSFSTSHINQPMQGGARPEASGQDIAQVACDEGLVDEDDLPDLKMLSYRRADGTRQHKKIPSPQFS